MYVPKVKETCYFVVRAKDNRGRAVTQAVLLQEMLVGRSILIDKVGKYMKKTVTIKSNRDFQRLYHRGKSAASGTLVLYCQRSRSGESRLGITTGTKLGHAVVRNRVRRQVREIYRLHRDELVPGKDLVVVVRVRAVQQGYHAMERDFLRLAKKLGLLKEQGISDGRKQ
jgi:ribonuclease P protein component